MELLAVWALVTTSSMALMVVLFALVRWLLRRRFRVEQESRHRLLFRFWDGRRIRGVDPIAIIQTIDNHPQYRWDLHPGRVARGESAAIRETVDAVSQAFGTTMFTEVGKPGLTTDEHLQLLATFLRWVDLQKKSTDNMRTLLQSTGEPTPSTTSDQTTPCTSDCG